MQNEKRKASTTVKKMNMQTITIHHRREGYIKLKTTEDKTAKRQTKTITRITCRLKGG